MDLHGHIVLTGRRVELDDAPGAETERVATELYREARVPLWYEQQSPSVFPEADIEWSPLEQLTEER